MGEVRDIEFHINEFEHVDRPWESVLFEDLGAARGVGGGGESGANPNVNEVRFEGAERVNDGWDLTFNNTGDTQQNITQFRLNYYNSQSQGQGNQITSGDVLDGSGGSVPFDVGGDRVSLDPPVSLQAGDEENLEIRDIDSKNNDWFIVTLDYDDGTRAQYFVSD